MKHFSKSALAICGLLAAIPTVVWAQIPTTGVQAPNQLIYSVPSDAGSSAGTVPNAGVSAATTATNTSAIVTNTAVSGSSAATTATNTGTTAAAQGTSGTSISQPTGGSGILGWLSGIYQKLGGTLTVQGSVNVPLSSTAAGASSTLTMPSATTAYVAGQLIASNATAGSVVVPSFAIANAGGAAAIQTLRLSSNDTTTTSWGGQTIQIDLWTAAPTFSTGDRATWTLATGSVSHLLTFTCTMSPANADGTYSECTTNGFTLPKLASGTSIYWSLKAVSGSGVTGASKIWTLIAEEIN
jgi:hypothetical protein